MTPEQLDRWKDFALRMARTCFAAHRRPSGAWVEEKVADFFDCLDERLVPLLIDWDHSENIPEGHPYYDPSSWNGNAAECVGDMMQGYLADERPSAPECAHCRAAGGGRWEAAECTCQDVEGLFLDQWDEQWGGPVRCCIRAGLDVASAPSAGVIGFTAGHVRRMYPEGVPEWVFPPGEELTAWGTGEPTGHTFADLPDDAPVGL